MPDRLPDEPPAPGALLDALPDIILVLRADGVITRVSGATAHAGWDPAAWTGRQVLDLVHPDDVVFAASSMGTVLGKDIGSPIDLRVHHPSLGWRWFEVVGADRTDDAELGAVVVACRDVTERRRWEVAGNDVARFQALIHHAATVAMLVDGDGRIESASGAVTRLLGLDPEAVQGRLLESLAAPGFESHLRAALFNASYRRDEAVHVEVPVSLVGNSSLARYRFEIVNLCTDPVIAGYVVTGHDVTELHAARVALEETATRDALTGLPSRAGLTEHLRTQLWTQSAESIVAVLMIDIDGFQSINDLAGHEAGDDLLRAIAHRLDDSLRVGDVVARAGGDEFAIVATGLPTVRALDDLATRVERLFMTPFEVNGHDVVAAASIGVAVADGASTVDSLLADADNAMRRVKRGRRHLSFSEHRDLAERRELARSLGDALGRGEIEAWFQPIVRSRTQRLLGYEALVRWRRADGSVLAPGQFLDVADEMGLTSTIDLAVAELACAQLAALHPDDDGPWVSVNVTAVDLTSCELTGQLLAIVARYGLTPGRLAVEVTEHAMLERESGAGGRDPSATLAELAEAGFRIVLDDFGTGYSSLTHVRTLSLRALKIDRSFIHTITTSPADRSVVAAVVGLAKALRLTTVAEGVETDEQLAAVIALGCDAAQGYLVSRPLPFDEIRLWTSNRRRGGRVAMVSSGPG